MTTRQIELSLTFDTAFNVGSGAMGGTVADKPLTRDARGLPMVPGSTIKGRLRHEVERLAPIYFPNDSPPCTTTSAQGMCTEDPCVVCRLFGAPQVAGKLTFDDLVLTSPHELTTERRPHRGTVRQGVGLSRHRRVAEDQLLFSAEAFLPGIPLTLSGAITGDLSQDELDLVLGALKSIPAIGGSRSRGWGWFTLEAECVDPPKQSSSPSIDLLADSIEVTVELESPLMIGTDVDEAYYINTRSYIPGSVLRGALATELLAACEHGPDEPHVGCDFGILFQALSAPAFEHLYPIYGSPTLAFPAPLTARTCKHHPGLAGGRDDADAGHGVGDILIRQSVYEEMLDRRAALPMLYEPTCPACGDEVEPYAEFMVMGEGWMDCVTVPLRRTSRTAIDRQRGVSADEQLYTIEMIDPRDQQHRPTRFRGRVRADPVQMRLLGRWLPRVRSVGKRRSTGLGQCRTSIRGVKRGTDEYPSLDQRVRAFDAAYRREWAFYERVAAARPLPDDTFHFCLDFLSPAVFSWHGLPVAHPQAEMLGLPGDIALERAFVDTETIGGWHLGAGLPRRTQQVVSMGSVYLYRISGTTLAELVGALGELEARGLGEDRARGMGRVMACLPFHTQAEVEL